MCSIGDDNDLEDLGAIAHIPLKEKLVLDSNCNKCREAKPIVVLRSKDKYCKECFLAGTSHKFKALLGKHKLIKPNDRVLILYECGHPSTALLHFIRTGLNLETHKKLRFEPVVLFLEEHFSLTLNDRYQLLKQVKEEAAKFNFNTYFTSFAECISGEVKLTQTVTDLQLKEDDQDIIKNSLDLHNRSKTKQSDYLQIEKRKILLKIAKHLNCKFIFSSEISNVVASELLIGVALGRGAHIALNTGFCDSRDDVKILRPLRLFDMKELAFYNHLHSLNPVTTVLSKDNQRSNSIQDLMLKFVNDLQVNYPATVTTILKTGDKLATHHEAKEKCAFCDGPIEDDNISVNSAESTQFSHWISTQAANSQNFTDVLSFEKSKSDRYCFACKNLLK